MTTKTTASEIQSQLGSVDHSGHNRIERNQLEDGEVREMIIGVGNGHFICGCMVDRSFPSPRRRPSPCSEGPLVTRPHWAVFSCQHRGNPVPTPRVPGDCHAHEKDQDLTSPEIPVPGYRESPRGQRNGVRLTARKIYELATSSPPIDWYAFNGVRGGYSPSNFNSNSC